MEPDGGEQKIEVIQSRKRFRAQEIDPGSSPPEDYTVENITNTLLTWIEKEKEITDFQKLLLKVPAYILKEVQNTVKDKRTILQKALQAKLIPVVRLLLDYGADLYIIPPEGNSTIHLAIYDKVMLREVINLINERLANEKEEIPKEYGKVVYYAIFEKKFDSLTILLEDGSPFRRFIDIDIMKVTPLHVGFGEGHPEAVKILIEAKADIFRRVQDDGILPLHVAAAKGNYENMCLLLGAYEKYIEDEKKKNNKLLSMEKLLGAKTRQTKMTAFNFACFRGNWKVLDLLLRITTAYLNTPSISGMCPIHYAVSEGQDVVVATLLSRNPNLFIEDRNGNNALVYAAYKNRYQSGALILNHINQHRYDLTHGPLKRNLIFDIKVYLVLFILETTRVMEVSVTFRPKFDEVMGDLEHLRKEFFEKSILVESKDMKWRKFHLVHMKYVDDCSEVISKGSGILRDYLPHAAEIILKSKYFVAKDEGRSFDFAYFQEEVTEEMKEDMRRIGFFFALVILAHPVSFPLASYIFKTLACEEVRLADLIGQSTADQIYRLKHLDEQQFEEMMIPNGAIVQINNKEQIEILFDKGQPFVSKSTFKKYLQQLKYFHLCGGGKEELLHALCQGFYSVIPKFFLHIDKENKVFPNPFLYSSNLITSDDLQQLLGDVPLVVQDWKQNTVYNLCSPSSPEVIWFWEIVSEETEEWRRKLLKFATGTSRLPIGTFHYLKNEKVPFTLELYNGNKGGYWLPTARTCTYTLTLPSSSSKDLLYQSLTYAFNHCDSFTYV